MKLTYEGKRKNFIFHIGFYSIENSTEYHGYTNKCSDSQYIVMLDYDGWDLAETIASKRFLEEKWGIFFDFLFSTGKGFHLVSLDKVPFNYLREVLEDSLCDPSFVRVPFDSLLHSNTLRLSKKRGEYPKLVRQFRRSDAQFELSSAHLALLMKAYPEIIEPRGFDSDNSSTLEVVSYWSKGR